MKDQLLIIGLVVAFVGGYVVGSFRNGGSTTVQVPLPSNYDPARAVYADAVKQAQDATDRCWKTVIAALTDRAKCEEKGVTH